VGQAAEQTRPPPLTRVQPSPLALLPRKLGMTLLPRKLGMTLLPRKLGMTLLPRKLGMTLLPRKLGMTLLLALLSMQPPLPRPLSPLRLLLLWLEACLLRST
jgi:hypothetical protein